MAACTRSMAAFLLCAMLLLQSRQSTFALRKNVQPSGSHCKPGMFDDRRQGAENGTQNCRPCSKCLPGYEASRLCGWYSDTECSPCPTGHYSATTSKVDGCIACSKCGKHKLVSRDCTASSNTVCSPDCTDGFFYSPLEEECLPCSPCVDHPQFEEASVRVEACAAAGMDPDMQCWPLPAHPMASESEFYPYDGDADLYDYNYESPTTTITSSDYHHRPMASSPCPRSLGTGDPVSDLDEDKAQIYTVVLVTLLLVVVLCVILSISIIVCLCQFMGKMSSRSSRWTDTSGYHSMSKKTSKLLVREPTSV